MLSRPLTEPEAERLAPLLTPRLPSPYADAHKTGLTVKQHAAHLVHQVYEVMYGGAGGGGKSWWLLAEALAYVDVPGYSAILFRSTWPNLSHEPNGLIPLSHDWLRDTDAEWSEKTRSWKFPSGAVVTFGHLATPKAHHNYAGPSYQYLAFDEVTEIRPIQYEFLQTRLRRVEGSEVPVRVRCASNPGGEFHDYYRRRFGLDGSDPEGRMYIPAKVTDNPHLDIADYTARLSALPPVLRARILDGDWSVDDTGGMFHVENVPVTEDWPRHGRTVRVWDLAATEAGPGKDPDWTAGVKMTIDGDRYWIVDVVRLQASPEKVETTVQAVASQDGRGCEQLVEQEPGASGKMVVDYFRRMLRGSAGKVGAVMPSGDKTTRAFPFAAALNEGRVHVVDADWNDVFLGQCGQFPNVAHDDMVDAAAHAFNALERRPSGGMLRDRTYSSL